MLKLKIHNYLFTVELYTPTVHENEMYHGVHESGVCGETLLCHTKIFINEDLAPEVMKWTIIHELTHAYIWSFGFDQYETLTHEQICEFMAGYGSMIMHDADVVYKKFMNEIKERGTICQGNVG